MRAIRPRGAQIFAFAAYGAVAVLVAVRPVLGLGAGLGIFLAGLIGYLFPWYARFYLGFLGAGLVGYAFLGRGFAYFGVPPLFVGEVLLGLGLVALFRDRVLEVAAKPVVWPLFAFMAIGLLRTVPYVDTYGLNAFRDGVVWAYGVFALVVASLVDREDRIVAALRAYRSCFPFFLAFVPLVAVVTSLPGIELPNTPFSEVAIVSLKGGDVAVHAAGILAFIILGLHRSMASSPSAPVRWWHTEGVLWAAWCAAFATTLPGRAALLTVAVVIAFVSVVRPSGRWVRLVLVAVLLAFAVFAVDETLPGEREREVSVEAVWLAVQSIVAPVGEDVYGGTRAWRLRWWRDIVGYTILGDHFWTGKGYGINLANADGYQVREDESLRSPHNGHLTVLARSGVPGLVAWLAVNFSLVAALVVAAGRRRAEGRPFWATVNLWLVAYWLAFMVNSSFDVFLEGPQGGIWFWCLVGFGYGVLRVQRTSRPA